MDFSKKEDRKKYLEEKFDNLLDVIGETYGSVLMEELVTRLDINPLIIWTALFWLACPVILTSKKAGISGLSSDANVIFAIKLL